MVEAELLSAIEAALLTASAKTATSHSVTITDSGPYSVTLDTMPEDDEDWYVGSLIEFQDGIVTPGSLNVARAIRSADVTAKTITWGRGIQGSFSIPLTATVRSTPLAGASVLMGDTAVKEFNCTVVPTGGDVRPLGISAGPVWELMTGGLLLMEVFPELPDDTDPTIFAKDKYKEFLYFKGQIDEIVAEHCSLSCWRVILGRHEIAYTSQPTGYRCEQKWGVRRVSS